MNRRILLASIPALFVSEAAALPETPEPQTGAPTISAYALVLSPTSPAFAGAPVVPVFAPILFVFVNVQNAAVGVQYTVSIAGATKNNGSFSMPGAFPPPGTPGAWSVFQSQLQLGDSVPIAPTVSLYIPAGVVSATVVNA